MPERKFDDFDDHASAYREIHTDNIRVSGADSFYFAEMKVKLLQPLEHNVPLELLDVGCGDGATEMYFEKLFPAFSLTGIDVSGRSIEAARARKIKSDFQLYDGITINFPDAAFDIIFMAGVLHHIHYDRHAALLLEIARVLKPGGRFYLYEHNPLNPLTRHLVSTCIFDKDAELLPVHYTISLLRKNGFSIRRKKFIIFFPRKGLLSGLVFLEKYLQWIPLGGQYFITAVLKN